MGSNLFKKNLCVLGEVNQSLASRVAQAINDESYHLLSAENGCPTLLVVKGGRKLFLHSRYNPVREALAWANAQEIDPDRKLVLLGFGLGYHVQALLKRISSDQQLCVYQQGLGIFQKALASMDLAELLQDSRLTLVVEDDQSIIARHLGGMLESGAQLLIHEPSLRAFPPGALREAINEWRIKKASVIRFGRLLEENFKANLPVISRLPLVNDYFGRLAGRPLLLAAGGPSLDEVLPYLRRANGIFVLAVGTAVAPLSRAGVRPDMVIVTDPQPVVAGQLTMLDTITPLIILPTVSPAVIAGRVPQLLLALQEGFALAEEMAGQKGVAPVAAGGSVSTTALDIAIRMGADPILLAGLDLAYPQGRMHAAGTVHGDNGPWSCDELETAGVDGSPVVTTPVLNIYRRWIERRIAQAETIEVINLSPFGAYIANTKSASPAFLLKYFAKGGRSNNDCR